MESNFVSYQRRINDLLKHCLSHSAPLSKPLYDAMGYAVLNGGKRLRPLYVYTLGVALGLPLQDLDHIACAIELIHAYSLIHDDLPCMDNDDWRRGKPSCHKQFGEAMALLAGDALQALAFNTLLKAPFQSIKVIKMLSVFAEAAGAQGMVAGQAMDFNRLGDSDRSNTESIHSLKTGSLFGAAFQLPAIAADLPKDSTLILKNVGHRVGLAFQIQDDICDDENIHFWQNPLNKESYLKHLEEQILADLGAVLSFSEEERQASQPPFIQLIKLLFIDKTIEDNYHVNREKSFL